MCVQGAIGFVEADCFEDVGTTEEGHVGGDDSDEVALVFVDLDVDVVFCEFGDG